MVNQTIFSGQYEADNFFNIQRNKLPLADINATESDTK